MMDQNLIHENLDFIRQSEYFRYLEEETIEPLLTRATRIEVTRDTHIPPPRQHHLIFLLHGTVDVIIEKPRSAKHRIATSDEEILFKREESGSCLNGLCDVLQILTRHIANQTRTHKPDVRRRSVTIPTWSSSDSHDGVWGMDYGVFLFRAASDCSLIMVPLPLGDVPDEDRSINSGDFLDVSARMVQAMLDRLYHVSLAKAVSHFGLDADAVKFETRLHDLLNKRHGEESNLADLFNGLLDDSWYSALQSFDGPLVRQLSLLNRKHSKHRRRGSDKSIGEKSTESNPKSTGARSSRTLFELPRPNFHSSTSSNGNLKVKAPTGPALSIDTSCTSLSNNFTQFSPTILSMTERKEKQFLSWDRAKLQRKGYMRNLVVEAIFSLLGFAAEKSSGGSATPTGRDSLSPFGDDAAENSDWKDPWAKGDGFYERAKESFIPWSEMVEFLDCVEVLVFQEGSYVAHQGERYPGLCLVVEGQLVASRAKPAMTSLDMPSYDEVYTISPGQLFGYGSLQINNRSMFDVQATTETHVGFLPRTAVQKIATKFPQVMLFMARRLLDAMPPMVALTDFALDWIPSEAGSKIYKKGDRGDSLYFVIKGRCRTTEVIPYTGDSVIKEICAGESFGALEIYTSKPRPADVEAVRRSEVVRLRKSSYQSLALYHPPLALCLWERIARNAPEMVERSVSVSRRPTSSRFRTIAICPLSREVPVDRVRDFFLNALVDTGICKRDGILECDSNIVIPSVGVPVYSRAGYINLQNYLAHLQENVELLLLTADSTTTSTWTDVCIANADLILLVSMSDGDPTYTAMEQKIDQSKTLAQRKLVLLNDGSDGLSLPAGTTRDWFNNRNMKKEQINIFKIAMPIHEMKSESNRQARRDFERMSRILFNRSIAVVLGGGGARGISHLGVLRALEEEGIPVDIIGGTSMGAFVAGLYAKTQSVQETYKLTEHFSKGVRTMTYIFQDLTLPLLSATTGKKFNSQIAEVFSDDLLSGDLKLDFFCSVTNMSKGSKNQTFYPHTNPIWKICRASMGIPPFAPPISVEGDLLIDGAFTANVPVFPAQGLGAETIFAFDVGYMDPLVDGGTHETISGWGIFWGKILKKFGWKGPAAAKANLPTLMDIINHVSYATHTNELRLIKSLPGCLYLHQPTAHIPVASYAMFNESYRVGYESAKRWLENLKGQGVFDHLAIGGRIRTEDGFVGYNFDGIEQGEV